jgi:hypothetical protein
MEKKTILFYDLFKRTRKTNIDFISKKVKTIIVRLHYHKNSVVRCLKEYPHLNYYRHKNVKKIIKEFNQYRLNIEYIGFLGTECKSCIKYFKKDQAALISLLT